MKLAAWLNSGNRAAFMIAAVFGTAYFGFFFDDNIFYFVFAAFYGVYAMMRAQFAPDAASTLFYRIFLGFAVILFISNAGRIMDTSISEFSGRDWRITFHPLVVLMILDASYFVVKHFKLNVPALSPYLIAAIIAGTLSFVFLGQDRTLGQILTITSERTSGIIERNFNLADDVYFFLTCSLVSLLLYLKTSRPVFWLTVLVSAALSLYFMLMVVGGQSRAAWRSHPYGPLIKPRHRRQSASPGPRQLWCAAYRWPPPEKQHRWILRLSTKLLHRPFDWTSHRGPEPHPAGSGLRR